MKFRRYTFLFFLLLISALILFTLGSQAEKIAPFLNALLMMGLPIVVGLWISKKLSVDLALFGVGAVTFIASQLFHIPFNSWILAPLIERFGLQITPGSINLAIFGLIFGFSAGFFEETARYLFYKLWIPKNR